MATPTTSSASIMSTCASGDSIPGLLPPSLGTIIYCGVLVAGNHTAVLQKCCSGSSGNFTVSLDGCYNYCMVTQPQLNVVQACADQGSIPASCVTVKDSGPVSTSTSSTSLTSAPTSTHTGAASSNMKISGSGVCMALLGLNALLQLLLL
jgi:hypothetical protein